MIAELPADPATTPLSVRDLVRNLGDIPLERIRLSPPPGTATIKDVELNKCCELIDGTLVEKAMGWRESVLGVHLAQIIGRFVSDGKLGILSGPDGSTEILPALVRIPDVAYFSWERFPKDGLPNDAVPELVPDLAVEVLSKGNTKAEMTRKRKEFFKAGVRQMWFVDPVKRTVTIWSSETDSLVLTETDTIDGGDVLPGFTLRVADVFATPERRR